MIVVSDTSPICYLLLIDKIEILAQLYRQVLIPTEVARELAHPNAPAIVRNWIAQPPKWLAINNITIPPDPDLDILDAGEKAAIVLAQRDNIDLIIIDEALGRQVAQSRGLRVTGLLGVLDEAARRNLLDFPEAISRLQQTSFRASPKLIELLLKSHQSSSNSPQEDKADN